MRHPALPLLALSLLFAPFSQAAPQRAPYDATYTCETCRLLAGTDGAGRECSSFSEDVRVLLEKAPPKGVKQKERGWFSRASFTPESAAQVESVQLRARYAKSDCHFAKIAMPPMTLFRVFVLSCSMTCTYQVK